VTLWGHVGRGKRLFGRKVREKKGTSLEGKVPGPCVRERRKQGEERGYRKKGGEK